MKCALCGSKDIPVYDGKDDDRAMEIGTYLHVFQVPFWIGKRNPDDPGENLFRVKLHFPKERPLCKKCRKKTVLDGLEKY